jgi:hypothetical protein
VEVSKGHFAFFLLLHEAQAGRRFAASCKPGPPFAASGLTCSGLNESEASPQIRRRDPNTSKRVLMDAAVGSVPLSGAIEVVNRSGFIGDCGLDPVLWSRDT